MSLILILLLNTDLKKNCKIKINKVSNFYALLLLDKQRFLCIYCNHTFIAETNVVDRKKQISNNTRLSIINDLMHKGSEKDIARRNGVSTSSTNKIMDQISKNTTVKNNGKLPSILGIDEFKTTNDTISKMAFIIVDQEIKIYF